MCSVLGCAEEPEWKNTLASLASGSVLSELHHVKKKIIKTTKKNQNKTPSHPPPKKKKPKQNPNKSMPLGSLRPEGGGYSSHEVGNKQK